MKKQSVSGISGTASLNYGFNNRVNGGLNINLRKGIWDIGFNYNRKYERAEIHSNLTRQLYSQSTIVEQQINSVQISLPMLRDFHNSKTNRKKYYFIRFKVHVSNMLITKYFCRQLQYLTVVIFNRK